MGIFTSNEKNKKKETTEEMIARLCAKCIINGDSLVESRKEVWDMATAARDKYLDIVKGFRASMKEELDKRAARWGEINVQKDALLKKADEAEVRLGEALINGDEAAVSAVEKDLDGIHKDIDRIDARLRIFEHATFQKSGETALAKAEAALQEYQLTLAECSRIMNAIYDAYWKHINDLDEKKRFFCPAIYPCNMASELEFKIHEKYSLDSLSHMANDPLTIEEIKNL